MKRMHQIAERITDLQRQLQRGSSRHSRNNDAELLKRELAELVEMTLETPDQFRAAAVKSAVGSTPGPMRSRSSRGATSGSSSRLPRSTATAA